MMLAAPDRLRDYAVGRLATGKLVFTRLDAAAELGVTEKAVFAAAARLERKKEIVRLHRGLYAAVPPEFRLAEAPPPAWYIDALMEHMRQHYYVGLLKAAELHGAAHQAVMDFQVITDRQTHPLRAGRTRVTFSVRRNWTDVPRWIEYRAVPTGRMAVSSPVLTAFDLVRYPKSSGGIDNIATVLSDLRDNLDANLLAECSTMFERSIGQRLGYLLDLSGAPDLTAPLHDAIMWRGRLPWTPLDPPSGIRNEAHEEFAERNERWKLAVQRVPELDQ